MKFAVPMMAGSATASAKRRDNVQPRLASATLWAAFALLVWGPASAQSMYKYQSDDGTWIFTDRAPPEEQEFEERELPAGSQPPTVTVTSSLVQRRVRLVVRNEFHVPVEVVIALDELKNVELPPPEMEMRWLVPARAQLQLLELSATADNVVPEIEFRHLWIFGEPGVTHSPERPYRAPFAVASDYEITQAYPIGATHNTADSRYAVDIAMPIGTDIYAARAGVVFEVASTNFRGGVDEERFAAAANLIRIMHDDGSHAVYAHLNWNTIRVRPGDHVQRGQYIADSGNTGFSSGPHLHFAVLQNSGLRLEAVPIVFEGPNSAEITPAAGNILTAY